MCVIRNGNKILRYANFAILLCNRTLWIDISIYIFLNTSCLQSADKQRNVRRPSRRVRKISKATIGLAISIGLIVRNSISLWH